MQHILERPCDYEQDRGGLQELWLDWRAAGDLRRYPTIWRLRLLLSSRVEDPVKDTRLWETASGQVVGFSMLWRRSRTDPYMVLDCFAQPACADRELISGMLEWADGRVQQILREQSVSLTAYANGLSQYDFSDGLLKDHGYAPMPPHPEQHNVYYYRPLDAVDVTAMVPAGFQIRLLQGSSDLAAYEQLYGFAKVSPLHLKELVESPEYQHLLVRDPAGEMAAYCECSVCHAEWGRAGQRLGWIDYVGTRPEQQGKGLGKAALVAGLLKLREMGAEAAMLVTVNTNRPAMGLYEKTGFQAVDVRELPAYQKTFTA